MIKVWLKPFNNKKFYTDFFSKERKITPFRDFDKKAKRFGIDLKIIDQKIIRQKYKGFVICFDIPYPWQLKLWINIILNKKNNNILFCFESPLVNPFNHFKLLSNFFKRIYTYNDELLDGKSFKKFNIPQKDLKLAVRPLPFSDRKFAAMVNAKKSPLLLFKLISPYKTDLYKERFKVIQFFENKYPKKFDLYGYGWNKPNRFKLSEWIIGFKKFDVYKGSVPDKIKTLSTYKFCFAFENSITPGYITEKIFDCFKAGCIPVYFGAPNVTEYIPKTSFIDFRDFNNYEELYKYMNNMDSETFNKYIKSGKNFIESKSTKSIWSVNKFLKIFIECVK